MKACKFFTSLPNAATVQGVHLAAATTSAQRKSFLPYPAINHTNRDFPCPSSTMLDPVSKALDVLAHGLRPYVARRATDDVLASAHSSRGAIRSWDAQALLVFMWDYWNELFRHELTFVERSLISELREYRNRWAHQRSLAENDIYRITDDIERLLIAVGSPEATAAGQLRRESLGRLWREQSGTLQAPDFFSKVWPFLLCGASGIALDTAIISFGHAPWSWLMAFLVFLALMRIAWWQVTRESLHQHGPHECSGCGCIIYTASCPYCHPPGSVQLNVSDLPDDIKSPYHTTSTA
ncbi:MAG: hypothetical protein RLZZ458_3558 [Planctomycetota bacterium]|jgi:hypothetical protein